MKCVDRSAQRLPASLSSNATRIAGVGAILAVSILATTGIFARAAQAGIDDALLQLGSSLTPLVESEPKPEELREIRLNGASVWLRTLSTQVPAARVLSRYEEACVDANSRVFHALGEAVGGLIGSAAEALGAIATSSHHSADGGYVACVDFGSSDGHRLLDGLHSLSHGASTDGLGALRYVYVEPTVSDSESKSFVLIVQASVDSLVRALVPPVGDAGGHDLPGFPRAKDTRRILSAWEVNRPSGLFSYITETQTAADLHSFYRKVLPEQGWKLVERHPGESIQIGRVRMLAAEKDRRLVTVITHSSAQTGAVLTILVSEPS